MPRKDFKNAIGGQRAVAPNTANPRRLGVAGEEKPDAIREELERAAAQLPVRDIAIGQLLDNPFQHLARPELDEAALEELANSIRQNGFYGALLARRKRGTSDRYELAYGHRRREAAKRADLHELPVKIIELDDAQMARIMASENFSREDLTPMGEANVVGYLSTMQNMTIDAIAEVIGKGKGWIQPRLALYEGPDDVKAMVEQKRETFSHSRLLIKVKDTAQRANLIREVLQNNLTFEQLSIYLEELKQNSATTQRFIDKNITSRIGDTDSDGVHNASRENARKGSQGTAYSEMQRMEALNRVYKAVSKFENLVSQADYQLSEQEKEKLSDIVERLGDLLENN